MLTKEVKAFIEILYLIGNEPLRVVREFPGKRRKNVWTGQP